MERKRLFAGVAIEAGAALREQVRVLKEELGGKSLRWTRLEKLHLTVEFFGEVGANWIPVLEGALEKAAGEAAPFEIELGGLGVFGGWRHPRVLWIGIQSEGLSLLHSRLQAALLAAGWTPEQRPFSPHLTLARLDRWRDPQRLARVVKAQGGGVLQKQDIRELILYESVAGRYERLRRWTLGGKSV